MRLCSNARGRDTRYDLEHLNAETFPCVTVHAALIPSYARVQLLEDDTCCASTYLQGNRLAHTIPPVGLGVRPDVGQ